MFKWIKTAWSGLEPKEMISGAALLVSLTALGVSIQVYRRTAEHDRLLVTPNLIVKFVDGSDPDVTGIVLENDGLGPARVLNVRLSVRGKFVAEITGDDQWEIVSEALGKDGNEEVVKGGKDVHHVSATSDFFILPSKTRPLLWLRNNERTPEGYKFLRLAQDHLQPSICYCSVYNECWNLVAPGQQDVPCESPLARYYLLNKGDLADQLKGKRRTTEPWSVH